MTSMILLLVLREDTADAAFNRYVKAMKAMPSYEVQLVSKGMKRPDITADMVVDGEKRLLYDATWAPGEFILSISPLGYREVDHYSKSYDDYPYPGGVKIYRSRISPRVPNSVPTWLWTTDLHQLLIPNAKLHFVRSDTFSGHTCDLVESDFSGQGFKAHFDFAIGSDGLIYRHHRIVDDANGHQELTWDFHDYKPQHALPDSRFENRIPDGFMPFSLPDHSTLPEVGRKPDFSGWVDSTSGKAWKPAVRKPVLFLLAGHNSLPSARALAALERWRSMLKNKGVVVAFASDAASSAEAKGLLYNPDRRSLRGLDVPATPMLFLMDSGGTLRNLWMGFIPRDADKLRDEVLNAAAAVK